MSDQYHIVSQEAKTARAEDRKYMRRHFSAMFMQSLLQSEIDTEIDRMPAIAISLANDLIAALEKEEEKV